VGRCAEEGLGVQVGRKWWWLWEENVRDSVSALTWVFIILDGTGTSETEGAGVCGFVTRSVRHDRTAELHSSVCFRTVGVLSGYLFLPILVFRVICVVGNRTRVFVFVPGFRYKDYWTREDQGDGHGQRCGANDRGNLGKPLSKVKCLSWRNLHQQMLYLYLVALPETPGVGQEWQRPRLCAF